MKKLDCLSKITVLLKQHQNLKKYSWGTNNIRRKHIYFLAEYNSEKALELDLENSVQLLEISAVS